MATYNETLYANKVILIDQDGTQTEQSGDAVLTMNANQSYTGYTYKTAKVIFDVQSSQYASNKVFDYYSAHTGKAYLKSKTLSCSDTQGYGLPSGSVYDAVVSGGSIDPHFTAGLSYWDDRFSTISFPSWRDTYLRVENGQLSSEISIYTIGCTRSAYSGTSYSGQATMTVAGKNDSSKKPYCTVVWKDIVPSVGGLLPSNGSFVNENASATFNWNSSAQNAFDGTAITLTDVFKWRVQGSGTEHTVQASNKSVTIPANTFPSTGTIEWCVTTTTNHGISTTSAWSTFTTTEQAPNAPTNLSPASSVIDGAIENRFSWSHNSPSGTAQNGADVQSSTDGTTWTSLATVSGSNEYYDVPANTFSNGNIYWRVRTYNTDSVASEWSAAVQNIVKAPPSAPSVTSVTQVPRSTVTWSSSDQVGYRVKFTDSDGVVYDTKERYGNDNTFRCPIYLSNGQTSVEVFVTNGSGLWSSTVITFNVQNTTGASVTLSVIDGRNTAYLGWNTSAEYTAYYVLKNGLPIDKTIIGQYEDKTACNGDVYSIRAVNGDNYTMSNEVTASINVRFACLFSVDNDGELIDLYIKKDAPSSISRSNSSVVSYKHYSGATYPTAYNSGYKEQTMSFTITDVHNVRDYLISLIGSVVYVKDKTSNGMYAVLGSVSETVDRYNDLSLSFTKVDYDGVIEYD